MAYVDWSSFSSSKKMGKIYKYMTQMLFLWFQKPSNMIWISFDSTLWRVIEHYSVFFVIKCTFKSEIVLFIYFFSFRILARVHITLQFYFTIQVFIRCLMSALHSCKTSIETRVELAQNYGCHIKLKKKCHYFGWQTCHSWFYAKDSPFFTL